MIAANCSKAVPQREIINDPYPQFVGYPKLIRRLARQSPHRQQGCGGHYQAPNLLEIAGSKLERINQPLHIDCSCLFGDRLWFAEAWNGYRSTCFLPMNGVALHV